MKTKKLKEDWNEHVHEQHYVREFYNFSPDSPLSDAIAEYWVPLIEKAREDGQKEVMKIANILTEQPDRSVRYVPLDKLFDAFKNL